MLICEIVSWQRVANLPSWVREDGCGHVTLNMLCAAPSFIYRPFRAEEAVFVTRFIRAGLRVSISKIAFSRRARRARTAVNVSESDVTLK